MTATPHSPFRFTGWHMTAILAAFFGVVIAVNVYMARLATHTFSGVVVENSYVASQQFNRWLDEAGREKALGWKASVARQADGRVAVSLAGITGASVCAEAWHPLGQLADRNLTFHTVAPGSYVSDQALPDGRWRLRLAVRVGQQLWRSNQAI